ncbi:MAG: metallophosphoesterase family protein [Halobacteriota archaeon]
MLVLGDAHANTPDRRAALLRAYRATDPDVALQLGDLFYYDLPVETYFIAGNNEDFDVIDALRHGRVRSRNTRNARLLDSRAVELDGLRIGGLSGNFAPTQYEKPRSALRGDRRRHFVRADVEALKRVGSVDVLLTHEAPHGTDVDEEYTVGCRPVDELISALSPDLCLTGHHHQHTETTVGDTRVITTAPAWESYYELDPDTLAVTRHETPGPDEEAEV